MFPILIFDKFGPDVLFVPENIDRPDYVMCFSVAVLQDFLLSKASSTGDWMIWIWIDICKLLDWVISLELSVLIDKNFFYFQQYCKS